MGNIVVGSALKQGMTVSNYVMLQAAVPSGAYNVNQANFQAFVDKDANDPTPDGANDLGYRGYFQNIPGNLINFYNDRDSALRDWNINNASDGILPAFKPNRFITATQSYGYNPSCQEGQRCTLVGWLTARLVLDPHESMAFVARSRTITAGREQTGGKIGSNNYDLDANFGFADEHSAEWSRGIQKLAPFYNEFLRRCDITFLP